MSHYMELKFRDVTSDCEDSASVNEGFDCR